MTRRTQIDLFEAPARAPAMYARPWAERPLGGVVGGRCKWCGKDDIPTGAAHHCAAAPDPVAARARHVDHHLPKLMSELDPSYAPLASQLLAANHDAHHPCGLSDLAEIARLLAERPRDALCMLVHRVQQLRGIPYDKRAALPDDPDDDCDDDDGGAP